MGGRNVSGVCGFFADVWSFLGMTQSRGFAESPKQFDIGTVGIIHFFWRMICFESIAG